MCLEAVANAQRHGDGGVVHLSWVVDERGAWELRVVNRTQEHGPPDPEPATLGLVSLSMRAEAIGAALTAGPSESGTWQVRCAGVADAVASSG
jgi:signal transduction histidine kinase